MSLIVSYYQHKTPKIMVLLKRSIKYKEREDNCACRKPNVSTQLLTIRVSDLIPTTNLDDANMNTDYSQPLDGLSPILNSQTL